MIRMGTEPAFTEPERRALQEMIDREAITQVLNDFARTVDELDFEAMARCFTEDLLWDYGPGAGVVITCRDDLLAFVTEAFSPEREVTEDSRVKVRIHKTSHHISNIRIDFGGSDTAHSETYVFTWHEMVDDARPGLVWGKWRDEWTRMPEGWRIHARKMIVSATDNYFAIGYDAWTGEPLYKPDDD
jgi:3-phenylpropionate/cinnamic acid dioxygenase small subunit